MDARVIAFGAVLISRGERRVTTVRGKATERLADGLDRAGDDDRAAPLLLAKATGHYKH